MLSLIMPAFLRPYYFTISEYTLIENEGLKEL